MNINDLQRENIKNLKAYATARDDFKGQAHVFLDANENNYGAPLSGVDLIKNTAYNRYPDPLQLDLKDAISKIKGVPIENTFLGNGSDEAIDILLRAFCNPGKDNIVVLPPTYGMYEVLAHLNDVEVRKVPLFPDFQPNMEKIAETIDTHTKIIFLCSPNNPSGNALIRSDIETILANFKGLVVVDEAYINYARHRSFIRELTEYTHLVVLQSFSKAWGLAGIRLGMAFSSVPVIDIMNKVKLPYNINQASAGLALAALQNIGIVNEQIKNTVAERERLMQLLPTLDVVEKVFPSDANFILVKMRDAQKTYNNLMEKGIIVRDRSAMSGCEGCLRISVGTPDENNLLLRTLTETA